MAQLLKLNFLSLFFCVFLLQSEFVLHSSLSTIETSTSLGTESFAHHSIVSRTVAVIVAKAVPWNVLGTA